MIWKLAFKMLFTIPFSNPLKYLRNLKNLERVTIGSKNTCVRHLSLLKHLKSYLFFRQQNMSDSSEILYDTSFGMNQIDLLPENRLSFLFTNKEFV